MNLYDRRVSAAMATSTHKHAGADLRINRNPVKEIYLKEQATGVVAVQRGQNTLSKP